MNCGYCFYRDVSKNRETYSYGSMSLDTLETLVKKVFLNSFESVAFAFQGGEPTLRGLDFYEKLIEYVTAYNINEIPVSYAIQTNGYALDNKWSEFLAKNKFLVGISLDGTKTIHDRYRMDNRDNGTHSKVMRTIRSFEKYGVEYNILMVVTSDIVKHIDSIYAFYKRNGFKYLQFIPCIDDFNTERGRNKSSLTPEMYEAFLKKLFDYWYRDIMNNDHTYIRYFESLMFLVVGQPSPDCGMNGHCQNQMVIEADGSVYPCDFYVLDKYRIGNIVTDDLESLMQYGQNGQFILESQDINEACQNCRWYALCKGGCRRDRQYGDTLGLNYFCEAYQGFFAYAIDRLRQLARKVLSQ